MLNIKNCDSLIKEWPVWMKKIFAYCAMEAKSHAAIRELLNKYEEDKKGFHSAEGKFEIQYTTRSY